MQSLSISLAAAPPPPAPPPTPADPPGVEAPDDPADLWDRASATAGRVGHAVARVPGVVVKLVPGLLEFAVVDAIVPLVTVTAAVGGVVAFVGVGASGVIEIVAGVRKRDAVTVLSGAGELSRGLFLGTVADAAVQRIPLSQGALGALGHACMLASRSRPRPRRRDAVSRGARLPPGR